MFFSHKHISTRLFPIDMYTQMGMCIYHIVVSRAAASRFTFWGCQKYLEQSVQSHLISYNRNKEILIFQEISILYIKHWKHNKKCFKSTKWSKCHFQTSAILVVYLKTLDLLIKYKPITVWYIFHHTQKFTHCCLVTSYGDIDLGPHWLR